MATRNSLFLSLGRDADVHDVLEVVKKVRDRSAKHAEDTAYRIAI